MKKITDIIDQIIVTDNAAFAIDQGAAAFVTGQMPEREEKLREMGIDIGQQEPNRIVVLVAEFMTECLTEAELFAVYTREVATIHLGLHIVIADEMRQNPGVKPPSFDRICNETYRCAVKEVGADTLIDSIRKSIDGLAKSNALDRFFKAEGMNITEAQREEIRTKLIEGSRPRIVQIRALGLEIDNERKY